MYYVFRKSGCLVFFSSSLGYYISCCLGWSLESPCNVEISPPLGANLVHRSICNKFPWNLANTISIYILKTI